MNRTRKRATVGYRIPLQPQISLRPDVPRPEWKQIVNDSGLANLAGRGRSRLMATRRSNLAARAQGDERAAPRGKSPPRMVLADDAGHAPRFSPVRALQARLSEATSAPQSDRWSPRATLLFTVGVCTAFWAAMGGALMVVFR